jgi:hypothetical protein
MIDDDCEEGPSTLKPVELLAVPKVGAVTVRFLADPEGLCTHWTSKGSIWCPGPGRCPAREHNGRLTWKAYAPVDRWCPAPDERWEAWVLEISLRLYEQLIGHELRGTIWRLHREKLKGDKEQCVGELLGAHQEELLRKAFPILPTLQLVFGRPDIVAGAECPFVRRQFLPARMEGKPPKVQPTPKPKEEAPAIDPATRRGIKDLLARIGEKPGERGAEEQRRASPPPPAPSSPSSNGRHAPPPE